MSKDSASAAIEGSLPNGLRYHLQPQGNGSNKLSLRLLIRCGSLDEKSDEAGAAHLVEHLAFNDTAKYPAGSLAPVLQRFGFTWISDVTADTSYTYTLYKLDLPGKPALLDDALDVLREIAENIQFNPRTIDGERRVIQSELLARDTADTQHAVDVRATLLGNTDLLSHPPGGTASSISAISAEALKRFYQRCYQPSRMTLVVVGDIAPANGVERITRHFGKLRSQAATEAPTTVTPPALDEIAAHPMSNARASGATAALVAMRATQLNSPEARQAAFAESVVALALERQLASANRAQPTPFENTAVLSGWSLDGQIAYTNIEVRTTSDRWSPAVAFIEAELRRAHEQGLATEEVSRCAQLTLAALTTNLEAFAAAPAEAVADAVAKALASGQPWVEPTVQLREARAVVQGLNAQTARAALERIFFQTPPQLFVESSDAEKITSSAITEAYRTSARQPLATLNVSSPATVALDLQEIIGAKPGKASATARKSLGVTEVQFDNGVRLSLRAKSKRPDYFNLVARVGDGTRDLPVDRPALDWLAYLLSVRGQLGGHTLSELHPWLASHSLEASLNLSGDVDRQLLFSLSGPVSELETGLGFFSLWLKRLEIHPGDLPSAIADYTSLHAEWFGTARQVAALESNFRLFHGDSRLRLPPPVDLATYDFASAEKWLREQWQGGPLEIGLVTSGDVRATTKLLERTIGALPPRQPHAATNRAGYELSHRTFDGVLHPAVSDRAALLRLSWPIAFDQDDSSSCALELALDAAVDRLRLELRQNQGETYTPVGRLYRVPAQPTVGFISIEMTCDPAKADMIAAEAQQIVDRLANHGLTKEEFSRLRAPRLATSRENLQSDDWWLENILPRQQSQPTLAQTATQLPSQYEKLTLNKTNGTAKNLAQSLGNALVVAPRLNHPGQPP